MSHPFFTVGHSNRTVAELADLLVGAGVQRVADVRTVPRSRANPQFNPGQRGPTTDRREQMNS